MGRQRKKRICKITGWCSGLPVPVVATARGLLCGAHPGLLCFPGPNPGCQPPCSPDSCLCSDHRLSPSAQPLCQVDWTRLSWTPLGGWPDYPLAQEKMPSYRHQRIGQRDAAGVSPACLPSREQDLRCPREDQLTGRELLGKPVRGFFPVWDAERGPPKLKIPRRHLMKQEYALQMEPDGA